MKNKINLLMLVLLLNTGTFSAVAQDTSDSVATENYARARVILNSLSSELGLSTKQQDDIRAILYLRHDNFIEAQFLDAAEKIQAINKANEAARAKVAEILTEDQLDKYLSLREYLRKQREKQGKPKKLDEELDF